MLFGPAPREFTQCSTADCPRRAVARGLCTNCYQQRRRSGQLVPQAVGPKLVRLRSYIPAELEWKLNRFCRITGKNLSQVVREMLEEKLEKV